MGGILSKDGQQGTCDYSLGTNHLIFNWGMNYVFNPQATKK
jgi:hypothetical protein